MDDSLLSIARTLNSDLGRHVKKCSFSTHLSGRFYQNNSLESHKARAQRIAQMKAKKKRLERSLELEEKKILFLEAKLEERRLMRLEEEKMKQMAERAAILIQSQIRGYLSFKRCQILRVENEISNYVAQFIQALFRGRRDRKRVNNIKMMIIKHRKEERAAIIMQSYTRQLLAKVELGQRIEQRIIKQNMAATQLQAHVRGVRDRKIVHDLIQQNAIVKIQAVYRGLLGRRIRDSRIEALKRKKEKAKKIPLHERRYSTYSIETTRRDSVRSRCHLSEISTTAVGNAIERRSSGSDMLQLNNKQEHEMKKEKENSETNVPVCKVTSNQCYHTQSDSLNDSHSHEKNNAHRPSPSDLSQEKINQSRQKAALRVAKLKRKAMLEKERQQKEARERKNAVERLELNRRLSMKQKKQARKDSTKTMQKEKNQDELISRVIPNPEGSNDDNSCKANLPDKGETNCSSQILESNKFDPIDFEEDFRENEFDLDDI